MRTHSRPRARLVAWAAPILIIAAVAVAGCGGSGSANPAAASGGGSSGASPTVTARQVSGVGTVLVDAQGHALYAADQEAGGTIHCTGACTSIWMPLAAGSGAPTAGASVAGKLAVVTRPDGARQVTYQGRPLYRFAQDASAGQVTGNGAQDSFGGSAFTWHAVTAGGGASSTSTSSGGGSAPHGYGY